jgi:hypothetical protein
VTAKKAFAFYIVFATLVAEYYSTNTSLETLFNYGALVDPESLVAAAQTLLIGLLMFFAGSALSKSLFAGVNDPLMVDRNTSIRVEAQRTLPQWQLLCCASVIVFYVCLFTVSVHENGLPKNLAERVFENKLSAFFMVALAYFGYTASLHRRTLLLRASIFIVAFAVVIIDGSRSGLIPILGLIFGALSRKRVFSALLLSYLFFFGANYAITARLLSDRLQLDIIYSYLFPDWELVLAALKLIFDYLFAFSILHFSYMSFVAKPEFTFVQLMTSINPLPSFLLDPDVIDSLRFEDRTRAIGGPAELWIAGPIAFSIGFFVLGIVASYADTLKKSRFRFIIFLMFLLATIIFFQYSLRTTMRMFSAIVLVVFFLRRFIKTRSPA